jgi:hypothetical protein
MRALRACFGGALVVAVCGATTGSVAATSQADRRVISSGLYAVTAARGTDVFYAVGDVRFRQPPNDGEIQDKNFVLRGHAGSWKELAVASPSNDTSFNDIAAPDATTIWAVGSWYDVDTQPDLLPLIEHSSGGSFTPQPVPSIPGGELSSVDAANPHDAWAVGARTNGFRHHPLALRWKGTVWKEYSLSLPRRIEDLTSLAVTGAHNAWMVGSYYRDATDSTSLRNLLLHWNGRTWSVADLPHKSTWQLMSVASTSAKYAAVVGNIETKNQTYVPTAAVWNGSRWRHVDAPKLGVYLEGVTLHGTKGWVTGTHLAAPVRPAMYRWTTRALRRVPAPRHGSRLTKVIGPAAIDADRHAVAVGYWIDVHTDPRAFSASHRGHGWDEDPTDDTVL